VGIAQITTAIEGLNEAMQQVADGIGRAREAAARLTNLAGRVSETLAPAALERTSDS
jgi:methyl-accepting chemotaxis protein